MLRRIRGGRWELAANPERGGRIVSLRLDGEELLDQGIGVDQPTAEGFVEGGAFGWDEMVPNVDATETLPDHGEAWRLPWEVQRHTSNELLMQCRGRIVPWELSRIIRLHENYAEFLYGYENVGKEPHDAYWCAHPLFRYDAEMPVSIEIPRPEAGRSAKVFLPHDTVDRVRLGRVELQWSIGLPGEVGVWVCNGDLGGYHQIAVEPSYVEPGLLPGETCSWGLQITAL